MTAQAEVQWGVRVHGPRAQMAVAATGGRFSETLARQPIGIGSPKASPPGQLPQTVTCLTTATAATKSRQVVGAPPTPRVSTTLAKTTSACPHRTLAVTGGEDVTGAS